MSDFGVVPVSTLAGLFGISERQVQLLASEGCIPKAGRKGYEVVPCVQAYVRHLKNDANVVNAEGLADFLDLSTAMVFKLHKQGMPRIKRGKYDLRACAQWYLQTFKDKIEGGGSGDMLDVRRQLLIQQGRTATINADLLEGKALPMVAVSAVLMEIGGIVVSQLDAMPGRIAHEVTGTKDPGEARQVVFKECRKIRDQIAGKVGDFAECIIADLEEDDSGATG